MQYDRSQKDAIPACFTSHLKVVKFLYSFHYLMKEEDIGFLTFILMNAMALEQMQLIGSESSFSPMPSPEVRRQLLSFPRGSNVASVVFS